MRENVTFLCCFLTSSTNVIDSIQAVITNAHFSDHLLINKEIIDRHQLLERLCSS